MSCIGAWKKNKTQTTWEFEPRSKWNTRHIHEARWHIFGWSSIEKLSKGKGKASWKHSSQVLHHPLSLSRTNWNKPCAGKKQSQHCCSAMGLLTKEQGEATAKFPSFPGKRTYSDYLIPFHPVNLVLCPCSSWVQSLDVEQFMWLCCCTVLTALPHLSDPCTKTNGKDFPAKSAAGSINLCWFFLVGLAKFGCWGIYPALLFPSTTDVTALLQVGYESVEIALALKPHQRNETFLGDATKVGNLSPVLNAKLVSPTSSTSPSTSFPIILSWNLYVFLTSNAAMMFQAKAPKHCKVKNQLHVPWGTTVTKFKGKMKEISLRIQFAFSNESSKTAMGEARLKKKELFWDSILKTTKK